MVIQRENTEVLIHLRQRLPGEQGQTKSNKVMLPQRLLHSNVYVILHSMHMQKGIDLSLASENCFKVNVGETSERKRERVGGAHMGFSKRIATILN